MLPRDLYAPVPAPGVAQQLSVSYVGGGLTREEIWATESESDAPREHRRRVSLDNGRTWGPFAPIETQVNEERPDGGLATRSGDPTFRRGRCGSGSQIELSAGIGKTIRKELIEAVARKAKGGAG